LYVIDTDVLSHGAPGKIKRDGAVADWLAHNGEHLYLSAVTVLETSYGISWLVHRRAARKAALLRAWLSDVLTFYEGRVIGVDRQIALRGGELLARAKARGFEVGVEDALVAATADLRGFAVLTRNLRHFRPLGVAHLDPFATLPPEA
jgi:hypothetical protein